MATFAPGRTSEPKGPDLGLRGWAMNLPAGRVAVTVEGRRAACEALLAALGSDDAPGSVGAIVHS
jgi:acylphosphatase